jgi:hypothetical protein
MKSYKFVNFLWDDAKAAALDPVGRLVYRSNILGSDQRITMLLGFAAILAGAGIRLRTRDARDY